jgi:hypothetical protein
MRPAVPPAVPYPDARGGNHPPVHIGTRSSGDNAPAGNGRPIREEKLKSRALRGEGPGTSGRANASEPLINVVMETEPKALTGSVPKGSAAGSGA